jgi:hypothetical protein
MPRKTKLDTAIELFEYAAARVMVPDLKEKIKQQEKTIEKQAEKIRDLEREIARHFPTPDFNTHGEDD